MDSNNFLKNLNPEQRKAVETVYGTVLVLAGPGTGKTHMLTHRIAFLLSQNIGIEADNILCLTFTENGATEMRNRLQKWVGNDAYKVHISTFHGFCESVFREYPEYFERKQGWNLVSDLDKALIFREAIDSREWKYLRPFGEPYNYQSDFSQRLSHLKREGVTKEKYKKLIFEERELGENDSSMFYTRKYKEFNKGDEKPSSRNKLERKIGKMEEFVILWDIFSKILKEKRFYDFDDQILDFLKEIESNDVLKMELQERFQFVLVDEYQDTNGVQNRILWSLTDYDDNPNLFVVGDDDQSIYRFQGANLQNILDFENRFSASKRVVLTRNYRSSSIICESALNTIGLNKERVDHNKQILAEGRHKDCPNKIQRQVFSSRLAEISFLLNQISEERKKGREFSDIAILVRTNREVKELATQLPKFGIPVSARVRENIFDDDNVKFIILSLSIFHNPLLEGELFELLQAPFWNISSSARMQLSIAYRKWKTEHRKNKTANFWEFVFSDLDVLEENLDKKEDDWKKEIRKTMQFFLRLRSEFAHVSLDILLHKIFHNSGMAKFISLQSKTEQIVSVMKIQKFFEFVTKEVASFSKDKKTLSDQCESLLENISLYKELGIMVASDLMPSEKQAVRIFTAHQSKGSEFSVVFVPGMLDRNWGNKTKKESLPIPSLFKTDHDDNEDERRLFFVAVTRAKEKLFMSYAEKNFDGKDKNPSLFWYELPEDLAPEIRSDEEEQKVLDLFPVFVLSEVPQFTVKEKDILSNLVKDFVWSASSLQVYLNCPRQFLFQNLLRFPTVRSPQNKFFNFGSAAHYALEIFFQKYSKEKVLPSSDYLLQVFEEALKNQNLTHSEFKESLNHGKDILPRYYESRKDSFSPFVITELALFQKSLQVEGIRIKGKIDKIEFTDETKQNAVVIDYKSGKPKGKIAYGNKNTEYLWRQLVFYDLLTKSANLPYQVESFALEFLAPDDKENFSRQSVVITEEDRQKVLQELHDCQEQLEKLDFPFVENFDNNDEIDYWQSFGK